MLSADDMKVLRFIDSKVVVYIHEVADAVWPSDPNRNLTAGSRIKALEADGYLVYRGQKKGYVVGTKKTEDLIESERKAKLKEEFKDSGPLFDEDPF